MTAFEVYPAPQEPVDIVAARTALAVAGYEVESAALNIAYTVFNGGYKTSFDKYLHHLIPFAASVSTNQTPEFMREHKDEIDRLLDQTLEHHNQFLEQDAASVNDFLQTNPGVLVKARQDSRFLPVTELGLMDVPSRQGRLAVKCGKKVLRATKHSKLLVDASRIATPAIRAVVKDYEF